MSLLSPSDEQFDVLLQKLMERLEEGQGETIYEIGVGGELEKKSSYLFIICCLKIKARLQWL